MSNPVKKLICNNSVIALNTSFHEANTLSLLDGRQQVEGAAIQAKYCEQAIEVLGSECHDVNSLAAEATDLLKSGRLPDAEEGKLIRLDDWFIAEMKGILLPA